MNIIYSIAIYTLFPAIVPLWGIMKPKLTMTTSVLELAESKGQSCTVSAQLFVRAVPAVSHTHTHTHTNGQTPPTETDCNFIEFVD